MKLIKAILSGQDVFVGRGGMRGGRRINEAESRMTKPLDATKQQELPQASPTVWVSGNIDK